MKNLTYNEREARSVLMNDKKAEENERWTKKDGEGIRRKKKEEESEEETRRTKKP